ncbi:MAG: ribosome recycling factor [Bacteroidetes bacterium]|nr:ribosome recycling factor [Bacteroidota bacterium]
MNEELQFILDSTKEAMINAIKHLEKQLLNIRAGKASPSMLGSVMVDYYGSQTPLSQVANVNTPDGRTITVAPWEKNMLQEIERAIMIANIGFNPMNNGETIIINVPPLTEERRRNLAKQAKSESEDAKIGIRNARKDANNDLKKLNEISEDLQKNTEFDVQEMTNLYVKKIDDIFHLKEKEIMTV